MNIEATAKTAATNHWKRRLYMKLKALQVKAFKHDGGLNEKQTLNDGDGLDLVATRKQTKTWRMRYRYQGKRPEMTIGGYPEYTLEEARKEAAKIRKQAAHNINPKTARIEDEQKRRQTFKFVSLEWLEVNRPSWKKDYPRKISHWLDGYAFPVIGDLPMDAIDEGHITEIMQSMSNTGCAPLLSVLNRIFGRAMASRLTKRNPAQGFPLRDVVPPLPETKNRARITDPKLLGQLMRDIKENAHGSYFTQQAIAIMPYVFTRPCELIQLKWECVDFENGIIQFNADDMKKSRVHIVPMATQVQAMLKSIHPVSGYCPYVFPNKLNSNKPMSKNVTTNLLRTMGYGADVCCSHGFRGTASTLLNAMGKDEAVIDLCLAHLAGTATSRAYNHYKKLPERKLIMQEWANYLDGLRDGAEVIPFNIKAAM